MSLRWRIFLAAVLLIVMPVGLLSGFYRDRFRRQATTAFTARAGADLLAALDTPGRLSAEAVRHLERLVTASTDDNRLRHALGGDPAEQAYLRRYAERSAHTAGLDMLQLMDGDGRILSSAHYAAEFGRLEPHLLQALAGADRAPATIFWGDLVLDADARTLAQRATPLAADSALLTDRDPRSAFVACVARRGFSVNGRAYHWIGGYRLDFPPPAAVQVAAGDDALIGPPGDDPFPLAARASVDLPLVTGSRLDTARLTAAVSRTALDAELRALDTTLLVALAAALAGAFLMAAAVSHRLSRPLAGLASRAAAVDLDDPAGDFPTRGGAEVRRLANVLNAMVVRLRDGARHLADAESRATLGDVARQVNHDLRNGITPVRNVVRHLAQTAEDDPGALADVFTSRRGTLESSLAYLEELAGRYARLAPDRRPQRCRLADIAREVAAAHGDVQTRLDPEAPDVLADPVSLRRIMENLLRNARQALPDTGGAVALGVARTDDPDLGPHCVLTVTDDGEGMTAEVQARIFEDFYTTRSGGTGLGLSNVRRLAGDAGGHLQVDSAPGRGTTITITFPAAEADG